LRVHSQDNNDYEIQFMREMLQKFNASSYKLLEKAIRSGSSQVKDLKSVEDSQITAFEDQCADINSKNPDLFTATVVDLKLWIGRSQARILEEQAERKEAYRAKMTEYVQSLRSENDIINSSSQTIAAILGVEAERTYVNAFENEVEPNLRSFIQV
jgi:hypothetical protein